MIKLTYRGVTYERHSSETPERSFRKVRSLAETEVSDSLAVNNLIYRGVTYYKFSYQETIFFKLFTE